MGLGRAVFEKAVFEKREEEGRTGMGSLRPGLPSQLTKWRAVIAWVGHCPSLSHIVSRKDDRRVLH